MARYEFKLPDIGEGIAEAEIVAWHVKVGDEVEEDQHIADLMTDKATVEMESPVAGRVVALSGEIGDNVAIGSVLIVVETENGAAAHPPQNPSRRDKVALGDGLGADPSLPVAIESVLTEKEGPSEKDRRMGQGHTDDRRAQDAADAAGPSASRILASPAVRERARSLGIDLALVRSAADGRVRHADLDAYLLYNGGVADRTFPTVRSDEQIKVVGLRRRIAEKMEQSKRRIPHFSYVEEVDVTALQATRAMMNEDRDDKVRLSLLPFITVALCRAIDQFPVVNAWFDDDAGMITRHAAVHMGIAAQTGGGLMVPVVRDADRRGIWELAGEIARLAEAARAGTVSRNELGGSTITVSSLGPLGGLVATPVINRPEVAIVAVNRIVERPVVIEGRIEIRKMMNLSSSFDHRVIDGWDAARFIQEVKRLLEHPLRLLSLR